MDLTAIDISVAGLRAQRQRMDLIAMNLANADTTGAVPYRRQIATMTAGAGGLPVVTVTEDPSEFRVEQRPGHPHAAADGSVRFSNVDPMVETVDLIAASRAYEANVTAMEVTKSMHQVALRILG
jgi:flagellar basal-body rod protein FlgC